MLARAHGLGVRDSTPIGDSLIAEVIGFEGSKTLLAPLDGADGISPGDQVRLRHSMAQVLVGPEIIGRVMDAAARPMDDQGPITGAARVPLDNDPVPAMQRPPIDHVLTTGIRTIDSLLTLGRGQRMGIFAGSGVGKSTLLAMMARGTDAEVVVIGLIGERGREVQEFLQRELGEEGRRKCIYGRRYQRSTGSPARASCDDSDRNCGILSRSWQACLADDGLGDTLCDGSA